ncbi:MAG TPA: class I SAM-dependent rRNA methyltransferase, partial [Sorangium sp.]|nr:class I SAM-dependent rRNA methyltransferase [Sorangium sp.]
GLVRRKEDVVAALVAVMNPKAIIDRTPPAAAKAEGFNTVAANERQLYGRTVETLTFMERGLHYQLPITLTQKTGFYFDQRPLRTRIEALSRGSRVLDGCCYVGAVALNAARGGASEVVAVDRSTAAIEAGKQCAALNGMADEIHFVVSDIHAAFEQAEKDGGYDIVVCDPPKLAPQRRNRQRGMGGYRRMAAGACRATKAGGLVALCSCSAAVSADALQRALALGARDAGKRALVLERFFQGVDHPVAAAFPEGLYLKVLLSRVEPL